jgi:hypothetical protein
MTMIMMMIIIIKIIIINTGCFVKNMGWKGLQEIITEYLLFRSGIRRKENVNMKLTEIILRKVGRLTSLGMLSFLRSCFIGFRN